MIQRRLYENILSVEKPQWYRHTSQQALLKTAYYSSKMKFHVID